MLASDLTARSTIERVRLSSATSGKLFFAQVREDAAVEIEAIDPASRHHVVVITSGGCTALALADAGAREVTAVDANTTQNDLAELKAWALRTLKHSEATGFLGATPMTSAERLMHYQRLRGLLSEQARRTWDRRRQDIARGVIGCGATERFLRRIVWLVTHLVVGRKGIRALLDAPDLETQRHVFHRHWDNRRWRLVFRFLLNRWVCTRLYTPEFFEHVDTEDFSSHFRHTVEHGLCELPAGSNPYLQQLLATTRRPTCLPPYLTSKSVASATGSLVLTDATLEEHLDTVPPGTVDAFCLSNICEWLAPADVDRLFSKVLRAASPDAVVVWRNFVGWTDPPPSCVGRLEVDDEVSARLSRQDRSLLQCRVVVARVCASAGRSAPHDARSGR